MDLTKNMIEVKELLWKHLKNNPSVQNSIDLTYDENVFYVRISPGTSIKQFEKIITILQKKVSNENVEFYFLRDSVIIVGSVATEEDAIRWKEAKVNAEKKMMLEIKKESEEKMKKRLKKERNG